MFIVALFASVSYVAIRFMTEVNFMAIVWCFGLAISVVGVATGGASVDAISTHHTGAFLGLGVCILGFLGQCCVNRAVQLVPAGVSTLIRNVDVPTSYLLAIIFLHEVPHPVSVLGSAMVVSGSFIAGIGKLLAGRRNR